MSRNKKQPASGLPNGPALVITDMLLMLAAILGTFYAFCGAYSIVPARGPLVSCIVAAMMFTVVFSMPRYRWIPLGMFAVGFAIAVWQLWPQLRQGAYAVYADIANVLAQWFSVELLELPAALSAAEWQSVRSLFLSMSAAVLALALGWTVVRLHSALLTLVLTLSPLLPALLFDAVPPWPALLVLAACWLTLLFTTLLRSRSKNEAGRFTAMVLPVCVLLVVLLSAIFPQDEYSHPQWAFNAYLRLTELGARFADGILPGNWPSGGTGMSAGVSAGINLNEAGPLQYTGQTVLRISTEVPGRVYLRGFSAAVYEQNQWRQIDSQDYRAFADANGTDWSGASQPAYFPFFTNPLYTTPYRIEVENIAAPSGSVYYPSQLVPSSRDGSVENAVFSEDICLTPQNDVRVHTFYYYQPDDLLRDSDYTQETWQAERLYRDFVEQQYLGVPEGFEESIADWWHDAEPLWDDYSPNVNAFPEQYRDRLSTAWKIAYLLDQTAQYDADVTAVPPGEDFVSYFLTQSRRGYCMHFASAATLLLRSMGIPARYVSGYAVTASQSGTVDVPDAAAHAWVEIYLDGYGWHPVEVTPAVAADVPVPGDASDEMVEPDTPAEPEADETQQPLNETEQDAQAEDAVDSAEQIDQDAVHTSWWWLMLLPAVAICVLVRRPIVLWTRRRRICGADTNQAVLAAYGWLQNLQKWGGHTTDAVEELARKARFSNHTLTDAERNVVLAQLRQEAQRIDQSLTFWKRLVYRYIFVLR